MMPIPVTPPPTPQSQQLYIVSPMASKRHNSITMRSPSPFCILTVFALSLSTTTLSIAKENPVSFYIVFQWPGSYCGAEHGCCYPETGKPSADFTIGGIWPFTFSGGRPTNCKSKSHFSLSKISNLTKSLEKNWPSLSCPSSRSKELWKHEWQTYGTCSESLFKSQHQYFYAALKLRQKVDILKLLTNAGIHPNGSFYSERAVYNAIESTVMNIPGIVCNEDKAGNKQLYQILLCGDTQGNNIVDCLGLPLGNCSEKIKFPSF